MMKTKIVLLIFSFSIASYCSTDSCCCNSTEYYYKNVNEIIFSPDLKCSCKYLKRYKLIKLSESMVLFSDIFMYNYIQVHYAKPNQIGYDNMLSSLSPFYKRQYLGFKNIWGDTIVFINAFSTLVKPIYDIRNDLFIPSHDTTCWQFYINVNKGKCLKFIKPKYISLK